MDNFSASLRVSKPAVTGQNGVVAAQHCRAAEVGARVLAQGGDAVDAAIATSFALGVLEPWMSGIGGGGAMVLYRAAEKRYSVIDFGMRAPAPGFAVIVLLPQLLAAKGNAEMPTLVRWPDWRSFAMIVGAIAVVAFGLYSVSYADAKSAYAVAAAIHAWIELPVLLLALGQGFRPANR